MTKSWSDYDIEEFDDSVLSGRNLDGGRRGLGSQRNGQSRPTGRGKLKAAWLADAVAKLDKKRAAESVQKKNRGKSQKTQTTRQKSMSEKRQGKTIAVAQTVPSSNPPQLNSRSKSSSVVGTSPGPVKRPMPTAIHPMLAESIEEPFDGAEWLFEIKWDGYRAIAFIEGGKVRLVSRNQNDLTRAISGVEGHGRPHQCEDCDSGWRSGRAR